MKKLGPIITVLAVFALLTWNLTSSAKADDDEQAITGVEHKLADATTAADALKYYDSGDDVTVFDMSGPPREYTGQKAIRTDFENAFAGLKDLKVTFVELKVETDGKFGYARSVQHFTAKTSDGKPVDMTFRQTDVLKKENGEWKIIHQHISVPVDMKTGKADMASKM
jgi:ketosteroid isomerase-like protein